MAPLAAGMPQLELLVATVRGEWQPNPVASFANLRRAFIIDRSDDFDCVRLSALLPVVHTLALDNGSGPYETGCDYQLQGLTAVTSLQLLHPWHNNFEIDNYVTLVSHTTLADLGTFPSLACLSLGVYDSLLPALAQLLPITLASLDLVVVPADPSATLFIDTALFGLSRLSALTTLRFAVQLLDPEDCDDNADVALTPDANLARLPSVFPCLRELILDEPPLEVCEAAELCTHPALRKLAVGVADSDGEDEHAHTEFEQLAADQAARGLTLIQYFPEVSNFWDSIWDSIDQNV